ncbi:MAG: RidA family protein [Verrucomicrobia bacterium]|nr:MAG: RidA family protein [Verrucomicrobiota bacterium]
MSAITTKLATLGLTLPAAPTPGGSYLPHRIQGNTLILAGVISSFDGRMTHTGQVGSEQTIETGRAAAKICALNVLAAIQNALGSLDRVEAFLYVGGYVNAVASFPDAPAVINGASDLFVELYGDAGRHARAAIAVAGLPKNATVEIQVTVAIKP